MLSALLARQALGRERQRAKPLLRNLFLAFMANAVVASVQTRERDGDVLERLRLHFVGTSYATNGHARQGVLTLARAAGIESLVDEHPSFS